MNMHVQSDDAVRLIVIDSFCGAGGVSEGFHRAQLDGAGCVRVVIGINHDAKAIASHAANHVDTVHFVEDFTVLDPAKLVGIVDGARQRYRNAKVLFWASAECTHHSRAKGGLSRDADSRSLPEHMYRYIEMLDPDLVGVENVTEFLDWGPLNVEGKPDKLRKGIYYRDWVNGIKAMGYAYEYRRLNAADFGAYTSRVRYFGVFAKEASLINFPVATHAKVATKRLLPWMAVKDVLDMDVEGDSIFGRKKGLCDATLDRIRHGILKFAGDKVAGDKVVSRSIDRSFLLRYNFMKHGGDRTVSIDVPCGTVTTNNRFGLVRFELAPKVGKFRFMQVAYSGNPGSKNFSINGPSRTVTTIDHHFFLTAYYGGGYNLSVSGPCGTVTTRDRFGLIQFVNKPKSGVKHNFLLNPQFNNTGWSVSRPCFTLIARMDKAPPYLITVDKGRSGFTVDRVDDTQSMRDLKKVMRDCGVVDIKMRMLMIEELKRIMGFGDDYILLGNQAEMKKFIGNAVECTQSRVIAEALCAGIVGRRTFVMDRQLNLFS